MRQSLNEIILRNLLTEREMAIASGNEKRLAELNAAIEIHHSMIVKDENDRKEKA